MMTTLAPTSQNLPIDLSPSAFGYLRETDPALPAEELLHRLETDGYLFLRGMHPREAVQAARDEILTILGEMGLTHPDHPATEGIAHPEARNNFTPDAAARCQSMREVVFGPHMMGFCANLFGEPALHFDYLWFRSIGPGKGTTPHCDWVYMGRGTRRLYTAWTPYGDTDMQLGGLMLLEGTHREGDRIRNYLDRDVDAYCVNGRHAAAIESGQLQGEFNGQLSNNPVSLREKYQTRWLTAEQFRMGDVLMFGMEMIHASLDNQTDRLRLSSDSRYQRASEPADERWMGANPVGHTLAGKRGRVC
ncbi:phytanoyl-CoA dioxygenase family protein [Cerasicoccus fimbriatus]|uniref:phytanoyl-CoA dioxygenase family protein n=1 Tax=Cerasicoccus fimbriatus TaxID=3014554 RepID=UPI0022B2D8A5|nr:phytanoyl-CoA dioxygenase family protein [Cerasicoccus sp. TK19100]